jgi:hypothetical protein
LFIRVPVGDGGSLVDPVQQEMGWNGVLVFPTKKQGKVDRFLNPVLHIANNHFQL